MLDVSIAGYLLLMGGEPALIVVAALLAASFGWSWPGGLTPACTALAIREAAVPRGAWRAGTVPPVFNTLLHLDAR